ncbi:MAG: helix-turn-helix domain-containing protein [Xanthobacteraceae bacterium]
MQNSFTALDDEIDGALTVEEFCRCYRVGRTVAYEEIGAGRLIARKRGSRTLIARDEARRWFRGLPPIELATAISSNPGT